MKLNNIINNLRALNKVLKSTVSTMNLIISEQKLYPLFGGVLKRGWTTDIGCTYGARAISHVSEILHVSLKNTYTNVMKQLVKHKTTNMSGFCRLRMPKSILNFVFEPAP